MEVARTVPVRDDAPGLGASAVNERLDAAVVVLVRLDEGQDGDVIALSRPGERHPFRLELGIVARVEDCLRPVAGASCTLGWSNGLIPIRAPATAVPNSHRKNS